MTPRQRAGSGSPTGFFTAVWALVSRVPRGRVTTYGAVARMLTGETGAARTVGWALHGLPAELVEKVPWWRVVNSAGRISTSCQLHSAADQAARLVAEGVAVDDQGRIALERYGWSGPSQLARPESPTTGASKRRASAQGAGWPRPARRASRTRRASSKGADARPAKGAFSARRASAQGADPRPGLSGRDTSRRPAGRTPALPLSPGRPAVSAEP